MYSTHSRSSPNLRSVSVVFFCCMLFFPFFASIFCTLFNDYTLTLTLTLSPSRISLSFSWGSHCISNHVLNCIVYVPTYLYWLGVLLVLPLLIFFLPLGLPHPVLFIRAFACSRGGGRCLVLASCCLVLSRSKFRSPLFPPRLIVCCLSFPFLVFFFTFFQLLIHKQTSG